jgi:TIR domain
MLTATSCRPNGVSAVMSESPASKQADEQTTTPDSYSAFISYAKTDGESAQEICASLETRGFRCWIAPRDVRAGREYGNEIIRGIEKSRCLVLVLSEAANESPFVRREVERAVSKRKPVFPIRIEEVLPSPGLELFVSTTHWIDAWSGSMHDHLSRLARDLGDESILEEASQASRKIELRRRIPKWLMAGGAFLAIIVAIVLANQLSQKLVRPTSIDSHQGQTDATRQYLRDQGVDPDAIAQKDIRVVPFSGNAAPLQIGLKIEMSEAATKLSRIGGLYYKIGKGEFQRLIGDTLRPHQFSLRELAAAGAISLKIESPLAGKTVGPFEYKIAVEELFLKNLKEIVNQRAQWLVFERGYIQFPDFDKIYPGLKRVRWGEDANKLDITIPLQELDFDALLAASPQGFFPRAQFPRYPYRPGAKAIFVQLDYRDGTSSKVRKSVPDPGRSHVVGIRMPVLEAPGNAAPVAYAAWDFSHAGNPFDFSDVNWHLLVNAVYPDVSETLYAFDDGGLLPLQHTLSNEVWGLENCLARGKPTAGFIRLLFKLEGGLELGPIKYSLRGLENAKFQTCKAQLLADLRSNVRASRMREGGVMVSSPESAPSANWHWQAVQEIHFRFEPENTQATIPVRPDGTWDTSEAGGIQGTRYTSVSPWTAVFAQQNPTGVYVSLALRDGTNIDEIRLPLN